MIVNDIKELLNAKYKQYATLDFIVNDPITIPHQFTKKEDIEIAGFLAAILAWGLRKTIIKNCEWLIQQMDYSPHDFILNFDKKDLKKFVNFKHRTFNGIDCIYFLTSLQHIYKNKGGLEKCFKTNQKVNKVEYGIVQFRNIFFELSNYPTRTEKHISSPLKKSTCKRINMYLRWMVRKDAVDFGLWKCLKPSDLLLPLDVHTARISRALGLLNSNQNNWEAVNLLSDNLRQFDPVDPIKYDLALFGIGVYNDLT